MTFLRATVFAMLVLAACSTDPPPPAVSVPASAPTPTAPAAAPDPTPTLAAPEPSPAPTETAPTEPAPTAPVASSKPPPPKPSKGNPADPLAAPTVSNTFGNGHGRLSSSPSKGSPSIRQGAVQVNGKLPPEVIQRIVRQNFGRFRLCYESGLRGDPKLAGRIATKFTIDQSGAIEGAPSDAGSDLPDTAVRACVFRGFANLSFPQPEGGKVTVVFPIIFNPGD